MSQDLSVTGFAAMGPGLMLLCLRAVSSYLELLAFVERWESDSPGFSTAQ